MARDRLLPRPPERATDVSIVVLLLLFSVPTGGSAWERAATPVLGILASVPLLWRRRRPFTVFSVVAAVCFAQWALGIRPKPLDIALLVATYSVGCYASREALFAALGVGYGGSLLVAIRWSSGGRIPLALLAPAAVVTAAGLLGDNIRTRRAYLAGLEERAARLEAERDAQAQVAAAAERARIAREMHDVVAHSLAVMIAQADGAVYALDADPDRARGAMETVASTGRSALGEMRRLLGVLRSAAAAAELGPQPGMDDIAAVVDRMRDAGMPVELRISGSPAPMTQGMSLTAYRLVQESLTNVLKHAGPGARARVEVSHRPGGVALRVTDDGRAPLPAPPTGPGHGIAGMKERAALYGGRVEAGPEAGGGWRVEAWLPAEVPV